MQTDTIRDAAEVLRKIDAAVRSTPRARTVELTQTIDDAMPWDTGHYIVSAVYDGAGRPLPEAAAELRTNVELTALVAGYLTEYDTLAQLVDAGELDGEPEGQYFYRNTPRP